MTHSLLHLSKSKNFRAVLVGVALIIILLIMVWIRVFYGSMHAYHEGERHLKSKQDIKAITFFDRSIHWYAPFNPYVQNSAERLWEISKDAQKRGDIFLALIAARTIRRGFIAARSFYAPGKDWIEKCNLRVFELLKIEQSGKGNPAPEEPAAGISVLEDPQVKGPDTLWVILLLAGLMGWIGSVVGFIMSGFRIPQGSGLSGFSKFKWIVLWAASFAIWVIGMMKA